MTPKLETQTEEVTLQVPQDLTGPQRERLAVALYDAHMVSQGRAAEIAGISRSELLDALGRHGVYPSQYRAEEAIAEAPQVKRPSVLGKYAYVTGGSEEFAREKQAEIEREDRAC